MLIDSYLEWFSRFFGFLDGKRNTQILGAAVVAWLNDDGAAAFGRTHAVGGGEGITTYLAEQDHVTLCNRSGASSFVPNYVGVSRRHAGFNSFARTQFERYGEALGVEVVLIVVVVARRRIGVLFVGLTDLGRC